jgi:hypothetical protein
MSAVENSVFLWVHAANVKEVECQQGFVSVNESVAKKLLEAGQAQDAMIGAFEMKELEDPAAAPKEPKVKKEPATKVDVTLQQAEQQLKAAAAALEG